MGAGRQQLARLALTTGRSALRSLAKQIGDEIVGQDALADAGGAMQQVGMGMPLAPGQLLPERCLPGIDLSHAGAPAA
ncbi:hypothetical protein D9M71_192600 [compost metagenome]